MASFDNRKKGHEKKFAHDQEIEFRARSRRNKYIGKWAAEQMGLDEADTIEYIKEIIHAAVGGALDKAVLGKILEDFQEKDVEINEEQITKEMDRLMQVAKDEFK